MKWYNIDFWKAVVSTTILIFCAYLLVGCKTPKYASTTFITDKQNEKKFDSLFSTRLSYAFEQWQHSQKSESAKATRDSSYVKDSTATRFDANGNKIGEDRFHYESHNRSEKDYQRLLDSIRYYQTFKDSASYYRNLCDSLSKIEVPPSLLKTITQEKSLSWFQKMFLVTGQIFWLIVVLILIYLLIKLKLRRKGS